MRHTRITRHNALIRLERKVVVGVIGLMVAILIVQWVTIGQAARNAEAFMIAKNVVVAMNVLYIHNDMSYRADSNGSLLEKLYAIEKGIQHFATRDSSPGEVTPLFHGSDSFIIHVRGAGRCAREYWATEQGVKETGTLPGG